MATTFDGLVNLSPVDSGTTHVVNDLTGLEPGMIDGLKREGSMETVEQLWTRVKNNAYERLILDFEVLLTEKRDFVHEMAETKPPMPDPKLAFETYGDFVGVLVKASYSKLTALQFNQLIVWAETGGNAVIVLYDKLLQKELYRKSDQALTAGLNTVSLTIDAKKLELYGMELFIGIQTNVRLRPMNSNLGWSGPVDCVVYVSGCRVDNSFAETAFVETSWTWPVHLVAKVIGDIDEMANNNKIKLASAFRYLCGHLLLIERLSSDNFNSFTNTLAIRMEELRDDYHKQYKSQLIKALKIIYTNLDDSSEVTQQNPEHQGGLFTGSYI